MYEDPPDLRGFEHLDGLRRTLRTLQAMIRNAEQAIAVAEGALDCTPMPIRSARAASSWNVLEHYGK